MTGLIKRTIWQMKVFSIAVPIISLIAVGFTLVAPDEVENASDVRNTAIFIGIAAFIIGRVVLVVLRIFEDH